MVWTIKKKKKKSTNKKKKTKEWESNIFVVVVGGTWNERERGVLANLWKKEDGGKRRVKKGRRKVGRRVTVRWEMIGRKRIKKGRGSLMV